MPKIWGIRLIGRLPDWVSAKDVILEVLRRHDVSGGHGRIIEYYGPGVAELKVMDRHVIANMGVEVGAVATIFPSDEETRRYLAAQGREQDWRPLAAEANALVPCSLTFVDVRRRSLMTGSRNEKVFRIPVRPSDGVGPGRFSQGLESDSFRG